MNECFGGITPIMLTDVLSPMKRDVQRIRAGERVMLRRWLLRSGKDAKGIYDMEILEGLVKERGGDPETLRKKGVTG